MIDAIDAIQASMTEDIWRLSVTGQNLVNSSTPAFRRLIPVTAGFDDRVQLAAMADQTGLPGGPGSAVINSAEAGGVRRTGRALDVAVEGNGFIELQGPSGPLFWRGGSLTVDGMGRLVTANGTAVAGDGGSVRVGEGDLHIDRDGAISEGDRVVGRLNVIDVPNPHTLEYLGDGLYRPTDGFSGGEPVAGMVRQGYLGLSNVDYAQEMVQLMELTRHFELSQRVLTGSLNMTDTALELIGSF